MNRNKLPSQEFLRAIVDYDPETGIFTWLHRPEWTFGESKYSRRRVAKAWNAAWAGVEAFTAPHSNPGGGRQAIIVGRHYLAARVAWKMVYGDDPEEVLAINGDSSDCRISNLRASAKIFSSKNDTMFSHNTSGARGVYWDKDRNLWKAAIRHNGRTKELGRFTTFNRALRARLAAEALFGWPTAKVEVAAEAAGATPAAHLEQLVAGGVPQ